MSVSPNTSCNSKRTPRKPVSTASIVARNSRGPRSPHTPTKADWTRLSSLWRRELDERIAQLTLLRDQLDDCIGCGCLSIDACKLRNPLDALSEQGSGPQRL
ncbi:MAG: MerR family DNA-binding protein [Massilia sp.]|nr:MerR family DNA-binding protein [Massilia sp.]